MWRGPRPPSNVQQLYNSHPEWSWYDKKGNRQPLVSGFYVSLNPCWPEPRKHVVSVCSDIVRRYPVDGLHLDYIRFPNEHPVENGQGYPQDERTLDLFKQDTGLHPRDVPEVWDQWRCDCVTALLRDIRRAAKSLRPQLVLTAAVGVERHEALNKFQDVDTWWRERLVDALVPMNYTECHRTYRARAEREWRRSIDRSAVGPVAPVKPRRVKLRKKYLSKQGPRQAVSPPERQWAPLPEPAVIMGTSLMHSNVRLQQQQLALALQRFGHFAVFCYSSLFSPRPPVRPKKGRGKGREQVVRPQDSLLPFLQVLSHASHLFKASVNSSVSQHPFLRTRSRLHPEEAFPYEQLEEFEEEGPPPTPLSVTDQLKKQWGKRGGGRRVVAPDGEVVTLRRRTWRRNILAEHRKEEELWEAVGEKRKVEQGVVLKQVGEKGTVDRSTEWEAVRMREAIAGEETM